MQTIAFRGLSGYSLLISMSIADFHPWFLSCALAPFGLAFGSFANVLIHRLPQEHPEDRNVATKPSHCPSCGKDIRWFHNIPIVSWAWLKGKCARCDWKIPIRYPLVELLTGLLFGISPWFFPFGTLIWLKGLVCGYALIVLFFTDLTEYILPDAIQFPLMALGLLFALPQMFWDEASFCINGGGTWGVMGVSAFHNALQPAPLLNGFGASVTIGASLLGLGIGYASPWAFNYAYVKIRNALTIRLSAKKPIESGMGMGDFKMLAWLGAFWGWQYMFGILLVAVVIMCVLVLPTHFLKRRESTAMYPLGCGLALATPIVVFWGPRIWHVYSMIGAGTV